MRRPTLADVRAGAERAYERWRRWPQWKRELELAPTSRQMMRKLQADRDEAQADVNSFAAQLNEAYDVIEKACSERDSLVIERDELRKCWGELQSVFHTPNPVSAAPKDGTLVWCLIPARWDDTRQAFIDRANVWVADDHMGEDIVTWLPRKDGS